MVTLSAAVGLAFSCRLLPTKEVPWIELDFDRTTKMLYPALVDPLIPPVMYISQIEINSDWYLKLNQRNHEIKIGTKVLQMLSTIIRQRPQSV